MDAGIYSNCVEQDGNNNNNNNGEQGGQEEFDLQEATECARLDVDEEAAQYYAYNNANGQQQQGQYNYDGQQQYNQQANQGEASLQYLIRCKVSLKCLAELIAHHIRFVSLFSRFYRPNSS